MPSAAAIHSGRFSAKSAIVSPRLKPSVASPFAKDRAQFASFSKDQRSSSFLPNASTAVLPSCSPNESTIDCSVRADVISWSLASRRAAIRLLFSLRFGYDLFCFNKAIGVNRNRVDSAFDEECGELGVVAGRFAADADLAIFLVRRANDLVHYVFHRLVSLIE